MQSSTRRCPSMSTFPASVNGVGAIGNTPAKDWVEDIKCNVYSDGGNRKSPATVEDHTPACGRSRDLLTGSMRWLQRRRMIASMISPFFVVPGQRFDAQPVFTLEHL